jgi:hypothetical protein
MKLFVPIKIRCCQLFAQLRRQKIRRIQFNEESTTLIWRLDITLLLIRQSGNFGGPCFLPKNRGFWPKKPRIPNIPYIRNIQNTFYSIYTEYFASKSNLYFFQNTRSDSNFNQKFDYDYGTQGLSHDPATGHGRIQTGRGLSSIEHFCGK